MKPFYVYTYPDDVAVELRHDSGKVFHGVQGVYQDRAGFCCEIDGVPDRWGAHLVVSRDGYVPITQRGIFCEEADRWSLFVDDVTLTPDPKNPPTPKVQPLHTSGEHFYRADGSRWTAALHSDFRLYRKWLDGDHDPLLDERIEAGSDGPRVFLTCDFLFKLGPHVDGSRFYDELPAFADYLEKRGCYWEAVAYTDRQLTGLGSDVWPRICEALANRPVLLQLVNEHFKNGVDPRAFAPVPNGCPQSPGSFVDGMFPVVTWPGGYQAFNPSRGWKWPATVGITLWELKDSWPGVWLIDEPIGAAEHDEPGRRATQAHLFQRMGADCGIWGAGGVFHSQSGLMSEPWGPRQRECANAFFEGLRG